MKYLLLDDRVIPVNSTLSIEKEIHVRRDGSTSDIWRVKVGDDESIYCGLEKLAQKVFDDIVESMQNNQGDIIDVREILCAVGNIEYIYFTSSEYGLLEE